MSIKGLLHATVACMALSITAAVASPINSPVPDNATITWNGLQWAWGSPCSYAGAGCGTAADLTYQGTQGWRLPTVSEFALVTAYDVGSPGNFANLFYFPGANVPYGGTDPVSGAVNAQPWTTPLNMGMACASPYFTAYSHCDGSDGAAGNWSGPVSLGTYDQLFVRSLAAGPTNPVPEPFSLSIFGAGLVGAAALRRRKKNAAA
jgi:hypothetical protein